MRYQINTSNWLTVESPGMRAKLATLFNIERKGGSVVHGTRVISDGYRSQELAGITIAKINALIGTSYAESDILKGFYDVVEALEKGITLPITPEENDKPSKDEGADRGGDENSAGDAKSDGQSGKDISPGSPKGSAKAPRGRKADAKPAADGDEGDTE